MNSENNKGKQENKSKNLNNSKSGADVKNSSLELTPIKRLKREFAYEGTILPTGSKGAFLTTYLSIPGRYFVLTPCREQLEISRDYIYLHGEPIALRESRL